MDTPAYYLAHRDHIIAQVTARQRKRSDERRAALGLLPLHDPRIPTGHKPWTKCLDMKPEDEFRWKLRSANQPVLLDLIE